MVVLDIFYLPQDTRAAHIQPTNAGSQYDNYQQAQAVSYRSAYNAPPTYQPVPQSNTPPPPMFVPSPATTAPVVSPVWFGFYINATSICLGFVAKLNSD